jgi:predicted thioesterase
MCFPRRERLLMRTIPAGTRGIFSMQVQDRHLASQFKDAILPDVFATPMMVLAMENAALNAIRPYLDPDESAVGTEVNVKHLAATPAGHRVEAEAVVTSVHGHRIEFAVSARDETEEIGRGTHARMVIDMERLKGRLDIKRGSTSGRGQGRP